jgi:hypothetical protein
VIVKTQDPRPDNYVGLIQFDISGPGAHVWLRNVTPSMVDVLKQLGAYEEEDRGDIEWVFRVDSDQALGQLLGKLRDMGILFGGDKAGWPPSAVFELFREKGYVQGEFQEVLWSGPGKWHIYTR